MDSNFIFYYDIRKFPIHKGGFFSLGLAAQEFFGETYFVYVAAANPRESAAGGEKRPFMDEN